MPPISYSLRSDGLFYDGTWSDLLICPDPRYVPFVKGFNVRIQWELTGDQDDTALNQIIVRILPTHYIPLATDKIKLLKNFVEFGNLIWLTSQTRSVDGLG